MSEENKELLEQVDAAENEADTQTTADAVEEKVEQSTPIEIDRRYRWSYQTETAHTTKRQKTKKRRGILLYATIMATAFLLCFAILFTMLLLIVMAIADILHLCV